MIGRTNVGGSDIVSREWMYEIQENSQPVTKYEFLDFDPLFVVAYWPNETVFFAAYRKSVTDDFTAIVGSGNGAVGVDPGGRLRVTVTFSGYRSVVPGGNTATAKIIVTGTPR